MSTGLLARGCDKPSFPRLGSTHKDVSYLTTSVLVLSSHDSGADASDLFRSDSVLGGRIHFDFPSFHYTPFMRAGRRALEGLLTA
jgi:hypothetical protein